MILSIIIPIYNVEEYIKTCFESIYSQGCDENLFEVIAVNDGTPDGSMTIVEEYQKKYSNLKIINQQNGGVSSARNTGITHAIGKYVTFVDPDDYLSINTLSPLCNKLSNSDCDILIMKLMTENGESYRWSGLFSENDIVDGTTMYLKGYTRGSVCGGGYKKDFLIENNISFPVGVRNGEDSIFFTNCQIYAKKISFSALSFYNVFTRPNSATTYIDQNAIERYRITANVVHNMINTNKDKLNVYQLSILSNALYRTISNWTYYSLFTKDVSLNFLIKELHIKDFPPIILKYSKGFSLSKKIGVILMNTSFPLYYFVMKVKYA